MSQNIKPASSRIQPHLTQTKHLSVNTLSTPCGTQTHTYTPSVTVKILMEQMNAHLKKHEQCTLSLLLTAQLTRWLAVQIPRLPDNPTSPPSEIQ